MAEPKVYHAKGKDDWGTTQGLFDVLDQEFHFDLDVCANGANAKCNAYLTEEMNALAIDWWGRCFMNPPHTQTEAFLTYMVKMLVEGKIELGVAVVAARTDTAAHHMATCFAGEIRYLKGRLSYELFPTSWQRNACLSMHGIHIESTAWPMLVKEIGLPMTAIQALMKDSTIPGGHPSLSQSAPFPSLVYIFDRRPTPLTVYWDWKKQQRTVYVFQGPAKVSGSPWLTMYNAVSKKGKLTAAKAALAAMKEVQEVEKAAAEKAQQAVIAAIAHKAGKLGLGFVHPPSQPSIFFLGSDGIKKIPVEGVSPHWLTSTKQLKEQQVKDFGMLMGVDWGAEPSTVIQDLAQMDALLTDDTPDDANDKENG